MVKQICAVEQGPVLTMSVVVFGRVRTATMFACLGTCLYPAWVGNRNGRGLTKLPLYYSANLVLKGLEAKDSIVLNNYS